LAAELLAVASRESVTSRLRRLRPFGLALAATGLSFIYIRSLVLPSVAGFAIYVPFQSLHLSNWHRMLTMVSLVPQWVRLLLWPAHLQAEYGPPQYPMAGGIDLTQLPGFLLLGAALGLIVAARQKAPMIALGLVWVVIALLPSSNFLVPTGILLAERTLFLPSIGAMLVVGAALPLIASRIPNPRHRAVGLAAVALLTTAGIVRSEVRTRVWRDNETLFTTSVVDAPLAYRSHYMLAGWRFDGHRLQDGEKEVRIALHLFPEEPFVAYNLGEEYRKMHMWEQAASMFQRSLDIVPDYKDALGRLAMCRAEQGRFPEARDAALKAIKQGASDMKLMVRILAAADSDARNGGVAASRVLPDTLQNPRFSSPVSRGGGGR
jgi:hypothetical protein